MSAEQPTAANQRDQRTATPGVYRRGNHYRVLTRPDGKRKVMHRFETYEEAVAFKAQQPNRARRRRSGPPTPRQNKRLRYLLCDPCAYCERPSTAFEHIYPKVRAGTDHWSNIVGICDQCNREKGTRSLLHYLLERRPLRDGADLFALLGCR